MSTAQATAFFALSPSACSNLGLLEQHQDRVAHELVDRPVVPEDDLAHVHEAAVEEIQHRERGMGRGNRGEPAQVREQDRHLAREVLVALGRAGELAEGALEHLLHPRPRLRGQRGAGLLDDDPLDLTQRFVDDRVLHLLGSLGALTATLYAVE
jgi:hypothetical protein